MALRPCFSRLTNIFFSTFPSDYENILLDEIWGCVKYVGIPYDTIMSMPIQNRRYFIQRHNHEQDKLAKEMGGPENGASFYGEEVNGFARNVQNSPLNGRR